MASLLVPKLDFSPRFLTRPLAFGPMRHREPVLRALGFPVSCGLALGWMRGPGLVRRRSSGSVKQGMQGQNGQSFPTIDFPENLSGRQKIEYALWWAWHKMKNPKPPSKEIKECIAFYHSCCWQVGKKKLLVDAAGGHGGIALVFRAFHRVERALVVDLYEPKSFKNLRSAWMPEDEGTSEAVDFQVGDISEAGWLKSILQTRNVDPSDVVVVACHACSLLSDELIDECISCQVEFAIMPCCHGGDNRRSKMMVNTGKLLEIPQGMVIDIARLGVIEGSPGYKATMRCIDSNITPQNRVLIGLHETASDIAKREADRSFALMRLARKYQHVGWRGEKVRSS